MAKKTAAQGGSPAAGASKSTSRKPPKSAGNSRASSGGSTFALFVLGLMGALIAGGLYLHQKGHLQPYMDALQSRSAQKTVPSHSERASENAKPPATSGGEGSNSEEVVKQKKESKTSKPPASEKKKAEPSPEKSKPKKEKKPVRVLQQSVGAQEPDYAIREDIRSADRLLSKKKNQKALEKFRDLLKQVPSCIRCRYGEAAALDALAEEQRSNQLVNEAIQAFGVVCSTSGGRKAVRLAACLRQSNRLSFLGRARHAIKELEKAIADIGEDVKLLEEVSLQCLIGGGNDKAKRYLKRLVELDPENGFGLGHLGFVYKLELKYEKAVPLMFAGLRGNDDRSRESRFYYHLGDALQRLNRSEEAYEVYAEGAERGTLNSMYQRSTYNAPNLKAQPWWTPEETPYAKDIKRIEKNWKTIRDEGLSVLGLKQGGFDPEEENLRKEGDWGQFTIFQQGRMLKDNCRKVPKTCELLKSVKDAAGCKRGQVKFSVMQPGTVVWPHCGPTNCRLRFHLGLVVPKDVHIRCGNDTRTWIEGKTIVFDDSFEHEVWHHGKSFRMILIMDFWHPDLSERQKQELTPI